MSMHFNKPKFDWEARDHLSELEQFKQECSGTIWQATFWEERCSESWIGSELDWMPVHNNTPFYGYYFR